MNPTNYSNNTSEVISNLVCIWLAILVGWIHNGTSLPLAQGLQTCRTTRLHWLQTGLTQAENRTFVVEDGTPALAPYGTHDPSTSSYTTLTRIQMLMQFGSGGSNPTLNDIPHTFAFYLFPQPDGFALPAWDAGRNYTALGAPDRLNFSVSAIADVVGAPVAANYYRTYNRSNTATGSFSNGTCPLYLAGNAGGNGSTGGGSGNGTTLPPAEFTGLAGRVESGAGYLLAVVGALVFAMV